MGNVNFDNKHHKFDDIEGKYRSFFAPAFEVIIDGKNLTRESVAISKITVDTTTEAKADSFDFTVTNAFDLVKREFQWLDTFFVPGKYVEIKMGYTDKLVTIFYGLITSVALNYAAESNPTITVKGMDISFIMMKVKKKLSWKEKKYSDIAKDVASKYTSKLFIDATTEKFPVISQNKQDDFSFLLSLAKKCNREFFIVGKTIYFRKPLKKIAPAITLVWGKNLRSFNTDMNIHGQVGKVVVTSWDEKTQKRIEATSKEVVKMGTNSKTGKDIMKALGEVTDFVESKVKSLSEAQEMADSILNEKAMKLITGSGESLGIPELRAGKYIKLEGVGKKMNQPLYLTSVSHSISASGYITNFKVGGNAI